MKNCPKCKTIKEDTEFFIKRYKNGKVGLRSYCTVCSQADRDEYRRTSSKDNDRNKAYNKEHAAEIRGKKLAKNYWPHMTWQQAVSEWDRLYNLQEGKCAFGHEAKLLHVDHCHTTGQVRGLLCYNCNNGLGRFKDDIAVLKKSIEYLEKYDKLNKNKKVAQ